MLTIENITKLYKMDTGVFWRIGKVETTNSAYLFTLMNTKGERTQINLERNPIGVQYELWRWSGYGFNPPLPNAFPIRRMLDKSKLKTPEILLEQIKNLLK